MAGTERRAGRNRTLTLSENERAEFSARLFVPQGREPIAVEELIDRTVAADLFETVDRLPAAFADLIIADPPYNLTKEFGDFRFRTRSGDQYLDYLRSWFPHVVRLLKPSGSLYLCGDWHSGAAGQRVMEEHLTLLNRITWQREKGRGAAANWKNGMEDIWFGVKDAKNYYFDLEAVKQRRRVLAPYREAGRPKDWEETPEGNFRLTCPSNFWDDITVPFWSMAENTDHPTQKPEKLIAKLILASCPPGGVVFDPFLGSGTTSVTAKKLGRHYCGVEMNLEYCLWAEKRLRAADLDRTIQGCTLRSDTDGIFRERNSENSPNPDIARRTRETRNAPRQHATPAQPSENKKNNITRR